MLSSFPYFTLQWAGETVASKVQRMRTHVQTLKAELLLVSMLDEVRIRSSKMSFSECACPESGHC